MRIKKKHYKFVSNGSEIGTTYASLSFARTVAFQLSQEKGIPANTILIIENLSH